MPDHDSQCAHPGDPTRRVVFTLPLSVGSRDLVRRQVNYPIDLADRKRANGTSYRCEVNYATRYTEHVRR